MSSQHCDDHGAHRSGGMRKLGQEPREQDRNHDEHEEHVVELVGQS